MEAVRAIRNVRAEKKVPIAQKITVKMIVPSPNDYFGAKAFLMKLIGADSILITDQKGENSRTDIHLVCKGMEVFIPLASLIDIDVERERIKKEIERVKGEVSRADAKLSNEKFVSRAPETVVNEERRKLAVAEEMLITLEEAIYAWPQGILERRAGRSMLLLRDIRMTASAWQSYRAGAGL